MSHHPFTRSLVNCALVVVTAIVLTGSPVRGESALDEVSQGLKHLALGPGVLDIQLGARVRYERLDNYTVKKYGTDEIDELLLTRLRLGLDYRIGETLRVFAQIQDAQYSMSDLSLDDFGQGCPFENPLELRQAFLEWTHIAGSPLGIKAGRQTIFYGDNRVWGPGEWGNAGRYTWDGVKLLWQSEPVQIDLIAAQRVVSDKSRFDDDHYGFMAYGAYVQVKQLPCTLDLFYIYKHGDEGDTVGEDGTGDLRSHTLGSYVKGKWGERIDYRATLAYQFGDWGQDKIRAYGLNAGLGYTFAAPWTPRLGVEFTMGSGDSDPADGTHGTFDGALGAVDSMYGRMNLFSWMNLEDYQASLSAKPTKKLKVALDYHYFRLAETTDAWYYCTGKAQQRDPSGETSAALGHEIDFRAIYKPWQQVQFMAGLGYFTPASYVRDTAGRPDDGLWFFAQASIDF